MNYFQLQLIKDLESKFSKTDATTFSISNIIKKIDDSKSMALDIKHFNNAMIKSINNELTEVMQSLSEQLSSHDIYCDVQNYDDSYHDYMRERMHATFCNKEQNRGKTRDCIFTIEPRLMYTNVRLPNGDYVQKLTDVLWQVFTLYDHSSVKFDTLNTLISSEYFEKKIIDILK